MTTVRIAGDAGTKADVVKGIASLMQVAAWIHSVSAHGPAEEWRGEETEAPAGPAATASTRPASASST